MRCHCQELFIHEIRLSTQMSETDDTPETPRILVFLASFNGERFIEKQLISIVRQTVVCDLIVSDDGSVDQTRDIVESFIQSAPSIRLIEGGQKGFVQNFLSVFDDELLSAYDYLAWCDQDDIWREDHLERGLKALSDAQGPVLYGSRTRLIDSQDKVIGYSPVWRRSMTFQNALVQSVFGGNTMLFNKEAIGWIQKCQKQLGASRFGWISHDWAAYTLISMAGYSIFYDTESTVNYRQHDSNLIGQNISFSARLSRACRLYDGRYGSWICQHLGLLGKLRAEMTSAAAETLDLFSSSIEQGGLWGLKSLSRSKVYRQGVLEGLALKVAIFGGWLKNTGR